MAHPTRLDYCQYLLSSPINYTLTHFADHSEGFNHDMINRYLSGDRIAPRLIWDHVNVAWLVLCVTTSDVPFSFGFDLSRLHIKQDDPFIKPNTDCWRTI